MMSQSKSSSSSESPPSCMSLPYNAVLKSVTKSFQSLLVSSPVTLRPYDGKPEKYLYVGLNLNLNNNPNPNPSWFILPLTRNQEKKLIPIPPFPHNVNTDMTCLVEIEMETGKTLRLKAMIHNGKLVCCGSCRVSTVLGLEALSSNHLISVGKADGGRKVTVWWKTYNTTEECKTTEIWCAEILIEYCKVEKKIRGFVEWSENVLTFQGCYESDDDSQFLLHSALVTHDH